MFFSDLRKNGTEMGENAVERFLWGSMGEGMVAEEVLRGGEECPAPAVAVAMFVGGVDKVLGDHAAGHL